MKKTIKRTMIIFAVIAVMMVCALAVTASAAELVCPVAAGTSTAHSSYYVKEVIYEPTCTQKGYTVKICEYCGVEIVDGYNYVAETGHSYTVSYREASDGNSYQRVLTCQNDLCQRAVPEDGLTELKNTFVVELDDYYSVRFVNRYESPEATDEDHADYFEEGYYVASVRDTWLAKDYLSRYYLSETTANDDGTVSSPDYEYILRDSEVQLFVKEGKTAPEYNGTVPYRYKDTTCGRYTFAGWVFEGKALADAVIVENTVFEAQFDEQYVSLVVTFYDGDGSQLTEGIVDVPYGGTVTYGMLKTPTMTDDQRYHYTFDGWTIGENGPTVYGTDEAIPVYHDASIFAHFDQQKNEYTVNLVDFFGDDLGSSSGVYYDGSVEAVNSVTSSDLEVPRDKAYIYTHTGAWVLKKYNGLDVSGTFEVNPRYLNVPVSITVKGEDGVTRTEKLKHGDTLTLAPKYSKKLVEYYIPISIKTVYFEEEDLFEDNSMVRSDILDDFSIQVTDANGQFVAGGMTDENGNFTLVTTYSDVLYITASTTSSSKYYGEHTLNLKDLTLEQIEKYEFTGIGIAPRVTQEWLDGNTHACSCICHSMFSTIVLRVYNILYRLFNIKYVCCDDLFVTHGSILAYTK